MHFDYQLSGRWILIGRWSADTTGLSGYRLAWFTGGNLATNDCSALIIHRKKRKKEEGFR